MSHFRTVSTRFEPNTNDNQTNAPLPSFCQVSEETSRVNRHQADFQALMMFTIRRPTVTQTLPLLSGESKTPQTDLIGREVNLPISLVKGMVLKSDL